MIIDVHAHLSDSRYEGKGDEIGIKTEFCAPGGIIDTAANMRSSQDAFDRANRIKNVYCTVGVHPEDAYEVTEENLEKLREYAKSEKCVAIGEIGLDYHFDNNPPKEVQKEAFVKQIIMADELGLPIVVHVRDAHGDVLKVLKENAGRIKNGLLIHCYSGSKELLREYDKLDAYYSYGGVITFKNAKEKPEIVRSTKTDRILLETDCPYMSPEPFRGRTNYPEYIVYTAEKMGEFLGKTREEVENITTENAKRLFKRLKI